MDHISISNRKNCQISGVKDVLSFDLEEIYLETEQGMLSIKGANLHVSRLSLEKGEVDIDGDLDSFVYSAPGMGKKAKSLFGKMFQ